MRGRERRASSDRLFVYPKAARSQKICPNAFVNGKISRDLSLTNQSREFTSFIGLYFIIEVRVPHARP